MHHQLESDSEDVSNTPPNLEREESSPMTSNPGSSDQNSDTMDESVDDEYKPSQTGGWETQNVYE